MLCRVAQGRVLGDRCCLCVPFSCLVQMWITCGPNVYQAMAERSALRYQVSWSSGGSWRWGGGAIPPSLFSSLTPAPTSAACEACQCRHGSGHHGAWDGGGGGGLDSCGGSVGALVWKYDCRGGGWHVEGSHI